jgi:hypothetical protein
VDWSHHYWDWDWIFGEILSLLFHTLLYGTFDGMIFFLCICYFVFRVFLQDFVNNQEVVCL